MQKKRDSSTNVLVFVVILILILLLAYKWLEYSSIKRLISTYDSAITQELAMTSELNKQYQDTYPKVLDFYKSASEAAAIQYKTYEVLMPSFDLFRSMEADYYKLIKENSKKFDSLNSVFSFFIGPKVDGIKQIIKSQSIYYKNEMSSNQNSLTEGAYFKNIFMIFNDMSKVNDFDAQAQSKAGVKKKFHLLSSIEKYTRSDFNFFEEDKIKKYAPNEYQGLIKYKRYFATYYEVMRLLVKDQENTQAATVLSNKLKQDSSALNIDFQGLFKDKEDLKLEETKAILITISDQLKNIYQINESKNISYPFVEPLRFTKHELWHCQLYNYKTAFFNSYKKEYPRAGSVDELIKDLSSISPRTTEIDKNFDRNIMHLENNDKAIRFTCIDKENKDEYSFVIIK